MSVCVVDVLRCDSHPDVGPPPAFRQVGAVNGAQLHGPLPARRGQEEWRLPVLWGQRRCCLAGARVPPAPVLVRQKGAGMPPPVPSAFPWCSRQGQCATPARPVCWALWQSSPLDQLVKSTGGCPDSETTILCLGFAEVASPLGPLSMCPHQAVGGVLPCPCAFPRPPAGCWGYFLSVFFCCVTLHIPQARCGLSNPFWTSKNYRQ